MFWFKTRRQHLNSQDGGFSARLNFVANLHYFHKMNGTAIGKLPMIDKRPLDLFHLHNCVRLRGGFNSVCRKKMWAQIGRELGYNGKIMTSLSTSLKSAYQKYIAPYDDFLVEAGIIHPLTFDKQLDSTNNGVFHENFKILNDDFTTDGYSHTIPILPGETMLLMSTGELLGKRKYDETMNDPDNLVENDIDTDKKAEKKFCSVSESSQKNSKESENKRESLTDRLYRGTKSDSGQNSSIRRFVFSNGNELKFFTFEPSTMAHDNSKLLNYSTVTCSDPPIIRFLKPLEDENQNFDENYIEPLEECENGFKESPSYNLKQFQQKADRFYEVYFKTKNLIGDSETLVSENTVENEYWKLLSNDSTFEVEYGSDIHTSIHGSPFFRPEKDINNHHIQDPWNFNSLPLNEKSFFRFIDTPISSLVQPWLFVGMIFSTQSWNFSDFYSYMVSYHHFGSTRTWYTVPEEDSEKFQELLISIIGKSQIDKNPQLLFQHKVMISPQTLKSHGIKCYVVDQRPGQIVVNFPKSYNSHFNHGFNFIETVKLLPFDDWLSYGNQCLSLFKKYQFQPPFCLEKLIIRLSKHDMTQNNFKL